MADGAERSVVEDEAHGHHHHGTGVRWVDLVIAGSAILISVVSLMVSIEHGRTMEKLVEANAVQVRASTLPILRFQHGNLDDRTGKPSIHFDLINGGTGPAVIEAFRLFYRDRPMARPGQLLDACCGRSSAHQAVWIINRVGGLTLPAGQSTPPLTVPREETDHAVFAALDRRRYEVSAKACYCSVLDECWITDFSRALRPTRRASGSPLSALPRRSLS